MHKKTAEENINGNGIGMQKRNTFIKAGIAISLLFILAFSGCVGTGNAAPDTEEDCADSVTCDLSPAEQPETPNEASSIEKIEVYHFHGTNQCYSCITVGDYAEETINTFFAKELESGKIVFGHINGELPENLALVKKYVATGSSLWIGTYTSDGKFSKEQNINVWYKIGNKQDYMNYLKGIIEKKLQGT